MTKLIKTRFHTKRFNLGTICKVKVPANKMDSHGAFHNAFVEIISKKDFTKRFKELEVTPDRVPCRMIKVPNAKHPDKVIGLEYALPRTWLRIEKAGKPRCDCDLRKVLMITGCVCGGI